MVMILIISGVIMPAFMWLLLYDNIVDQCIEIDGEQIMTETKAEAQRYVLIRTIKHPLFWLYMIYSSVIVGAAAISYDVLGLGWDEWFFALTL